MLKKSLLTLLVALTFIAGTVKAYSLEDAMADIASLKTQIVDLKSQLSAAVITTKLDTTVSAVRNPEVTPTTIKAPLTFTSQKNITPNTKGDDVIVLQTALKDAGYFTAPVTGTYGAKTEMAVKAFQKANNLPTTGVVGNLTKALLANPSNPPAPSQSCATTTAASWVKVLAPNGGETYIQGQQITVKWTTCSLLANNNMTIGIMNPAGAIVAVLTQSTPNDGVQTFTLPSTIQTGQYRVYVKTALNGTTYSDQSDNTFSVTASTLSSCNPNITTPSIKVISPNGGEVYTAGQQITVKWTSCNVPNTLPVFINLEGNNNITTNIVDATQGVLNDGSELVTLPTQGTWQGMQFGQIYKIRVGVGPFGNLSGSTSDNSDNLFTINAGTGCLPTSIPSVTVLSPNGGEVFTAGQQITVKWTSCNLPPTAQIGVFLEYVPTPVVYNMLGGYNASVPNTGIATITLPSILNWPGLPVSNPVSWGNNYKMYISTNFIFPFQPDLSDNLFTINSTPSLPVGCTSYAGFNSVNGTPCWLITQYTSLPEVTSTTANLYGYLFDGAPATITWSLVPSSPSLPSSYLVTSNGLLSASLAGLTPNTNYQYKVCGLTSAFGQYGCGLTMSFQTLP